MTIVILFTLGNQGLLERSYETAETALFTKKLNTIDAIYYAEEKRACLDADAAQQRRRNRQKEKSNKVRKRATL